MFAAEAESQGSLSRRPNATDGRGKAATGSSSVTAFAGRKQRSTDSASSVSMTTSGPPSRKNSAQAAAPAKDRFAGLMAPQPPAKKSLGSLSRTASFARK